MNPETPSDDSLVSLLNQLHDFREPAPVSMSPATPAWLVLAALVLLLLGWGLRLWLRHHRAGAYRRAALAELHGLEPALTAGDSAALSRLNELLRRVSLVAFPRSEVAALSGPDWAAFLTRTGGEAIAQAVPAMASASYSPGTPAFDGREVTRAARDWIRHHHA